MIVISYDSDYSDDNDDSDYSDYINDIDDSDDNDYSDDNDDSDDNDYSDDSDNDHAHFEPHSSKLCSLTQTILVIFPSLSYAVSSCWS
jgi:hypothetical protein